MTVIWQVFWQTPCQEIRPLENLSAASVPGRQLMAEVINVLVPGALFLLNPGFPKEYAESIFIDQTRFLL